MPLVPRAPWPSGIRASSRRRSKSISLSTSAETISTLPATEEVEGQARSPRSQTLKRCSSCGGSLHAQSDGPHQDTRGADLPTTSAHPATRDNTVTASPEAQTCLDVSSTLHLVERYAHRSSFSLLGNKEGNSVSNVQKNGAGTWKCKETHFQALVHAHGTVSVDHAISCQGQCCNVAYFQISGLIFERQQDTKCIICFLRGLALLGRMGHSDFSGFVPCSVPPDNSSRGNFSD